MMATLIPVQTAAMQIRTEVWKRTRNIMVIQITFLNVLNQIRAQADEGTRQTMATQTLVQTVVTQMRTGMEEDKEVLPKAPPPPPNLKF